MLSKQEPLILVKYGGNAMRDEALSHQIISILSELIRSGIKVVLAHGGGPFIQNTLDDYQIESEFIAGNRKTTPEALPYVEMALKGRVNSKIVQLFNKRHIKAVGLSGKDGQFVQAVKRYHLEKSNGKTKKIDIGRVGDVARVNPDLLYLLLNNEYTPVITCIASDEKGEDYNINADIMAGHVAGALQVDHYIVLTDVDGLMKDINEPESIIREATLDEIENTYRTYIKGGMIPKVEAIKVALRGGAKKASILNGTKPEQLKELLIQKHKTGTTIHL